MTLMELTPSRLAQPPKIAAERADLPLLGGGENGNIVVWRNKK
jgi:hypothetical protein